MHSCFIDLLLLFLLCFPLIPLPFSLFFLFFLYPSLPILIPNSSSSSFPLFLLLVPFPSYSSYISFLFLLLLSPASSCYSYIPLGSCMSLFPLENIEKIKIVRDSFYRHVPHCLPLIVSRLPLSHVLSLSLSLSLSLNTLSREVFIFVSSLMHVKTVKNCLQSRNIPSHYVTLYKAPHSRFRDK